MQRSPFDRPWPVLLRFPLVFGSFLLLMGVGFINRDRFLTHIPEERRKLNRENQVDIEMLNQFKKEKLKEDYKL